MIYTIDAYTRIGQNPINEDGLIINHQQSIFGVIDGVTSLNEETYEGLTAGRHATNAVQEYLNNHQQSKFNMMSIKDITMDANYAIDQRMKELNAHPIETKDRFQCCHAVIRINDDQKIIEWSQTADCMIYAIFRNEENEEERMIVKKINEDRFKSREIDRLEQWRNHNLDEFKRGEWPEEMKQEALNYRNFANLSSEYTVLNGDSALKKVLNNGSIPMSNLEAVILHTDGLYPVVNSQEDLIMDLYNEGCQLIADKIHQFELNDMDRMKVVRSKVHDDKAAIVIQFNK